VPARHVLAITSGKGGVGKSTIAVNVARALAARGHAVGLLDADLYGPDVPLMVGVTRTEPLRRWDFWRADVGSVKLEPVERFGVRIISVGFLVAERQALDWPAPVVEMLMRQLVHDVQWGELDYLIVDLPPGTADVPQHTLRVLEGPRALVVVGPQDVAHLDAKKVLAMLETANVPVIGAVENMSGLTCPHCGQEIDVFPRVAEERSIWALGVPELGRIPLDPGLGGVDDAVRPEFAALAAAVVERLSP
jgi:ATP-binding protein involved in chromosome partitioning